MVYTTRNKYIRQSINTLLVLTLVLSNLVNPYDSPALAQSSLRQKSTLQAEDAKEDLGKDLAGLKKPASISFKSSSGQKPSSAGVIASERYIKESGYDVIGGAENRRFSERLAYLTGVNALAHNPVVYSPLNDSGRKEALSLEFASTVAQEIKELAAKFKSEGKDNIRILIIGPGTGIDALCVFYHAKFVNQFKSVVVHAVDIQGEAVENTKFNFMLQLPGSRFEGDSLHFAKEEFEDDSVVVKCVEEGKEFDNLAEWYDLILFDAPDAVNPKRIYDTTVHMDQSVFKKILENIKGRLTPGGVALVRNLRNILDAEPGQGRYTRLIPDGFDIAYAGSGVLLGPSDWAIFKLTLEQSRQGEPLNINSAANLKSSSAGAVTVLPVVSAAPYIEKIDCIRSYLDKLAERVKEEEGTLDELSNAAVAEDFIEDAVKEAQKARIRLKQAEINIKNLSSRMKEQNLRSLINALRSVCDAEKKSSRLKKLAFLFMDEINALSRKTGRPNPVIDFNPENILFIPQKSWLGKMFDFHGAGKITEISDGKNSIEILLIKAEERSLAEIIKSILHETIQKGFTPGRRIIEKTQPELLMFYHILEEAATESLTMEIFEYFKKTDLGKYLLKEIPKKGIYDYISAEEYYLYERELLDILKRNLGERIGKCLEEFVTRGDLEPLRETLGEQAEEFLEELLTADDARPSKKILEKQARRYIDEFLINANPEPLRNILGPLWEKLISITERINMAAVIDISTQHLVYNTAVRVMFLFLPRPDAAAKLDAGIILLDALTEIDFEDVAEIEFELFLELGEDAFDICKDKAVLKIIKEILKADKINFKTARFDFHGKLYQYTIEEAKRLLAEKTSPASITHPESTRKLKMLKATADAVGQSA